MSEWKDEQNQRVKERDGEGKGRRVDTEKKGVAVFGVCPCPQAHFFLTVGTKHDICGEHRERNMKMSALLGKGALGKPQHRGIMGNDRRKLREVDPIISETQAAGKL